MARVGQISAWLQTDPGRVRSHNEDFVAAYEPADAAEARRNGWLYLVADGVGGAKAGEIASQVVCQRVLHHYLAAEAGPAGWEERLTAAIQAANADLRQLIGQQAAGERMATTLVALLIHDGRATFANVGDSRGYLWRAGELSQITEDHSLVARLVAEGAISGEEALTHPRRNVILRSLGPEAEPQIDLHTLELQLDDRLLLCSDGLTRHVSPAELAEFMEAEDLAATAASLVALANERGGEDNISVALLHEGGQLAPKSAGQGPAAATAPVTAPPRGNATERTTLWLYTALLCVVEVALITAIWFLVSS
ncbi:MAG: Stp1/IreP family PP2C-type Ser/Thr phosphatase [Candidatus Promineifilaceae bacterium]